MHLMALHLTT